MKFKKLILTLNVLFIVLLSSCNFEVKVDENAMYKNYKVDNAVLEAAGLPIVTIQTNRNKKILDKENWLPATMEITNASNTNWNKIYSIGVRGIGNTTWRENKKPYAIKLDKKDKLLGMGKDKHKRWVLLANFKDNSFMKNEVAFHISEKLNMDYTVQGQYVNLVLNGNYVGLYWLGEQIKVAADCRVTIDDENDFLIEYDSYFDEAWKFYTPKKHFPLQVKNDDYMTDGRLLELYTRINQIETLLYKSDFPYKDSSKTTYDTNFTSIIDVPSFAKFYIVNEIMANTELKHPKSCYFTYQTSNGVLKAGPVWDFDWGGYTGSADWKLKNTLYYDALFKTPVFTDELNSILASSDFDPEDMATFIDDTYSYIATSAALDGKRWGTKHRNFVGPACGNYEGYVNHLKDSVTSRMTHMKNTQF